MKQNTKNPDVSSTSSKNEVSKRETSLLAQSIIVAVITGIISTLGGFILWYSNYNTSQSDKMFDIRVNYLEKTSKLFIEFQISKEAQLESALLAEKYTSEYKQQYNKEPSKNDMELFMTNYYPDLVNKIKKHESISPDLQSQLLLNELYFSNGISDSIAKFQKNVYYSKYDYYRNLLEAKFIQKLKSLNLIESLKKNDSVIKIGIVTEDYLNVCREDIVKNMKSVIDIMYYEIQKEKK